MTQYIHGIHNPGGEHLMADKPGWIVFTEAIGSDANDRSGGDYRQWSDRGFGIIARLNNGYFPAGSIPAPSAYGAFAKRCASFVKASQGCDIYIIGNELNHLQEQIPGQPVTPAMYADCFNQCYAAIKAVAPNAQVVIAPVAPWDASTKYPANAHGDWIVYFVHVLMGIPRADGLALHAYSHGAGVHLITSSARMQPPFQNRRFEFRAYLDFLEAVPPDKRTLPIYITETDQVEPWVDANTGWVQAAYAEIDRHNETPGTQKIQALVLYRWDGDKWAFKDKQGVHADFRAAVAKAYATTATTPQEQTHMPQIGAGPLVPVVPNQPDISLPKISWDERLTARGVTVLPAQGQKAWRVVKAQWLDESQAGGRHHIYIDLLDEAGNRAVGVPLVVSWPSGSARITTEAKPGEPHSANYPMSSSLNEFSIRVDDGTPSDLVSGIGMGADGNPSIHTSTALTFQRTLVPATQLTPPAHPPQGDFTPSPVEGVPSLAHPVHNPALRRITQAFGSSNIDYWMFKVDGVPLKGHTGIDYGTPIGSVIVAVDAGRVVEVANDEQGFGFYIKISHRWGESLYAHLSEQHVQVGETVTKGEVIAKSGKSGNSTGPHLHFGLRVAPFNRRDGWGGFSDPEPYLRSTPAQPVAPAPLQPTGNLLPLIKTAAQEFGIDPYLFTSMVFAESRFDPKATSAAKAMGLAQITLLTWTEWSVKVGVSDPYNAVSSLRVGAAYLRWCLDQTGGDRIKALVAYNWGLGNLRSGAETPLETRIYAYSVVHGADLQRALEGIK